MYFLKRYLPLLLAGMLAAACSPLVLVNALVPDGGYSRTGDIAYRDGPRGRLDVYSPAARSGPSPVMVFFYGGSWQDGAREDYEFVGGAFARRGYTVVIPDYRVYPEVEFPAFVRDAANALRWTRDHIAAYGGDPRRIFIAGHSAGAHIAALLALDPRYLRDVGLRRDAICGLIGLAGPYAFDPLGTPSVKPVFVHLKNPDDARPVSFADSNSPPALLLHGLDDTTVRPENSRLLAKALRRAGTPATLDLLPDTGHAGLLLALSRPFDYWPEVHKAIADFVRKRGDCTRR